LRAEYAGALGIDPGPYSLAQLAEAARRKQDYDAHLTAWLCATIANRHRGETEPVYQPADFWPFRRGPRRLGRRRPARGIRLTADNVLAVGAGIIGHSRRIVSL
jgi:hypothetical protein